MELKFQVFTRIQKPVAEVFDAVYNPEKLSGYFTNGGASAPLDEGSVVEWSFDDGPDQQITFPVTVAEMVKNERIVFFWQSTSAGENTRVEMTFEADGDTTIVRVAESGWPESDLERSYSNCQGWAQMTSALKAYVEYGINLRKGAFEGLWSPSDH
jgi:uncharacterized protein YndB with AHSA1/START domain